MIRIDVTGRMPIYEQICSSICADISKGLLKENDKLPGARTLAKELGLNPNTVAKAYARLEHDGIIYSVAGRGCFVSSKAHRAESALTKDFENSVREALTAGVSEQRLIDIVRELADEMSDNKGGA